MCGRFTNMLTWRELVDLYRIHDQPDALNLRARYNIAPTQQVPMCHLVDGARRIDLARWGLVPQWAKDETAGRLSTFNARAETVAQKPSFRSAFKNGRRCLIPADGFYEWPKREDGSKQAYRICMADRRPFSFAGLWERNDRLDVTSCTIIVTEPNDFVAQLHDRMPVILDPEQYDAWLSPATTADDAKAMLRPYGGAMMAYPVDKAVGSTKNNDHPGLIEPVGEQLRAEAAKVKPLR